MDEKGCCGHHIERRLVLEKQMEGRLQNLEGQRKSLFYTKSDRKSIANIYV